MINVSVKIRREMIIQTKLF